MEQTTLKYPYSFKHKKGTGKWYITMPISWEVALPTAWEEVHHGNDVLATELLIQILVMPLLCITALVGGRSKGMDQIVQAHMSINMWDRFLRLKEMSWFLRPPCEIVWLTTFLKSFFGLMK